MDIECVGKNIITRDIRLLMGSKGYFQASDPNSHHVPRGLPCSPIGKNCIMSI